MKLLQNSESKKSSNCSTDFYLDYANQVRGLCKFVKSAYPDIIGAGGPPLENAELLLEKNRRNYRSDLVCLLLI